MKTLLTVLVTSSVFFSMAAQAAPSLSDQYKQREAKSVSNEKIKEDARDKEMELGQAYQELSQELKVDAQTVVVGKPELHYFRTNTVGQFFDLYAYFKLKNGQVCEVYSSVAGPGYASCH